MRCCNHQPNAEFHEELFLQDRSRKSKYIYQIICTNLFSLWHYLKGLWLIINPTDSARTSTLSDDLNSNGRSGGTGWMTNIAIGLFGMDWTLKSRSHSGALSAAIQKASLLLWKIKLWTCCQHGTKKIWVPDGKPTHDLSKTGRVLYPLIPMSYENSSITARISNIKG